ncbi:MAG TPA: hypothetical protein PKV98_09700 [Burkholderiaceae bacterium]|nr:hypothetical protein [Burkholderiaceae bacterium]
MHSRLASLIIAASIAVLTACSSSEKLSDGSVLGTMTAGQLPEVTIDGKAMRLAPGARIYNASNLTITPNQVPAGSRVRYLTDEAGLVKQVWILPAGQ